MEVVDIFRDIVAEVSERLTPKIKSINGVYYEHGHLIEINDTLTQKGKTSLEFQKYPLIMLLQDFPEVRQDGHKQLTLRLIITANTRADIKANERYEKVFKPLLVPVYKQLIDSIVWSGKFFWDGDLDNPPHTRTDRPFYGVGSENGNVRYIMSDKLDAIEVSELQLNYIEKDC